jgi:hypothetical protein
LKVEFLNEYDKLFHPAFPGMAKTAVGWWTLPEGEGTIPLIFTLRARKRA